MKRIKGLNGLRAIAALILLWGHMSQTDFVAWGKVSGWLPTCCAYVFFVISGFLAGFKHNGQHESLKKYYRKKAIRILPLYYFYILVTILVYSITQNSDVIINKNLLYYIFITPNIPFCGIGTAILPLVHLWFIGSLVLFYVSFPLIQILAGRKMLQISAIVAISWFVIRICLYLFIGKDTFIYKFCGTAGVDCLFGGVTLGILTNNNNKIIKRISDCNFIALAAWTLFLTSGIYSFCIPSVVRKEYIAILIGIMIVNQLSNNPALVLENRLWEFLGKISYEIYVCQILIIILLSNLYTNFGINIPKPMIFFSVTIIVILTSWMVNRLLNYLIQVSQNP